MRLVRGNGAESRKKRRRESSYVVELNAGDPEERKLLLAEAPISVLEVEPDVYEMFKLEGFATLLDVLESKGEDYDFLPAGSKLRRTAETSIREFFTEVGIEFSFADGGKAG